MSEEAPPGQAVVLAEIAEIRKATPFGTPGYTQEVDKRVQALYQRAYPEPDEEGQAPAGRQFPEQIRPRKEVKPRETVRRRTDRGATASPSNLKDAMREWAEAEGIEPDDDALGTHPIRGYAEKWGSYQPSYHDERQWDKAVRTAARIGVSPKQLGELRDALLEDAPIADDDDDLVASDYLPPPVSLPNDSDWLTYKGAAEIAARHGVSKAAFHELASFVLGASEALLKPRMRRLQDAAIDVIVDEHGGGAATAVRNAQKAIAHFGEPGLKALLDSPLASGLAVGDHPALVKIFDRVGMAIEFDALPKEFRSPKGSRRCSWRASIGASAPSPENGMSMKPTSRSADDGCISTEPSTASATRSNSIVNKRGILTPVLG